MIYPHTDLGVKNAPPTFYLDNQVKQSIKCISLQNAKFKETMEFKSFVFLHLYTLIINYISPLTF